MIAATIIQKTYRGYRARQLYSALMIEKLIKEQDQLFEDQEQFIDASNGQNFIINQMQQDKSQDSFSNNTSSTYQIPLGYKYQTTAQKIQKYLRGYLAKVHVSRMRLISSRTSNKRQNEELSSNRYKRTNVQCDQCGEKFGNSNQLQKHRSFIHSRQNSYQKEEKKQDLQIGSVRKFQEQYEREQDLASEQLTTPFRKLKLSKKQYQQWSDKIHYHFQQITNESQGPHHIRSPKEFQIIQNSNQNSNFKHNKKIQSSMSILSKGDSSQKDISSFTLHQKYQTLIDNQVISKFDQDNASMASLNPSLNQQSLPSLNKKQLMKQQNYSINSLEISPSIRAQLVKDLQNFKNVSQKQNHQISKETRPSMKVPGIKDIKRIQKKPFLFTPKSHRLNQPMLFEFDLYVRAATEIQRYFRGYLQRKRILGSLQNYKKSVIKVQRLIRAYLAKKASKYQKYLEFLDIKSKKIIHELKNFYKIYQKFEELPQTQNLNHQYQASKQQADKFKKQLEKGYIQVKKKYCPEFQKDSQVQTEIKLAHQDLTKSVGAYQDTNTYRSPIVKYDHLEENEISKDQMIYSLKSEVQALRLLLFKDVQSTLNFNNHQSIDPKEHSLRSNSQQMDEYEYRSLQVLKERLASLQKTNPDETFQSQRRTAINSSLIKFDQNELNQNHSVSHRQRPQTVQHFYQESLDPLIKPTALKQPFKK